MKYKITLTPLEPYLFGGDNTFGKLLNDKEKKETPELGTYLVKSRQFPQQSAILGMLRKEIMTQYNLLTRKVRGEWVDKDDKDKAINLVGDQKFDIQKQEPQNFGSINSISPIFLQRQNESFIKKVDIDSYKYQDGILQGYNPKKDIYDNFISIDSDTKLSSSDIFQPIEQIGNKKGGADNSLFKKTSYLLKDGFSFAFYADLECELKDSIVTLGADRSKFQMEVTKSNEELNYQDKNGYLTLLSDAYITLPIKEHCDFAITSELSYQNLIGKKSSMTKKDKPEKNKQNNPFQKSPKVYLYEKGSVFINPSSELIEHLNQHKNCQKIGYNIFK
jgi:CRISPR-associated protein Cmr3